MENFNVIMQHSNALIRNVSEIGINYVMEIRNVCMIQDIK